MRPLVLGAILVLATSAAPASGQEETEEALRRGRLLFARAEAAELLQRAGSEEEEAVARLGAGSYAEETGDGPGALAQYRRSRELWRKLGDADR